MSIETGHNIFKHPSIKRIVEIHPKSKQITLHDQRYYQRFPGNYYPSVTYVLSYFPKNKFFESWMKDVGHNADIIMRRAADEGTQVHDAIESYLKGEQLVWIEENGHVNYKVEVWKMIQRFAEFWEKYKPELVASEHFLFSDKYKYAGTGDIICKIGSEYWLLDIKTSNSLHRSFDLQTAAYAVAWNETHNVQVTRRGIIWLKSSKRGESKNKIQGDGWELRESEKTLEEDFELFKIAYQLFQLENNEAKPIIEQLPNTLKLEK